MLIYANFEHLDLNQLNSSIKEKILSLHNSNEELYKAIEQEDLSVTKHYLDLGFPINWKNALELFSPDEQIILDNFIPPAIPNSSDCTDDMGICFNNYYTNFELSLYHKKLTSVNYDMVELIASYFFKNKDFKYFNFFYFSTAKNKKLVQQYIQIKLKNSINYPSEFNGLLCNPDPHFFDLFVELKKDIEVKSIGYIFKKYQYDYLKPNEISYKKAFDIYLDEIINEKISSHSVQNLSKYTINDAINETFYSIYVPENLKEHIFSKYEELTGVDKHFTPVALAWYGIVKLDIYFEIEWESMSQDFKNKYPKQRTLSKGNLQRKKTFLDRENKQFRKVFDNFCEKYDLKYVVMQAKKLGIPTEYYSEVYQKVKLERILLLKPDVITNTKI